MSSAPARATHAIGETYYRKRPQGGADVWCADRGRWVYIEDKSAKRVMRFGKRLESAA